MGRFEPSNKRCNNSAPVFQHPLFTFHLLPPSPSFSPLEVSPTLTRNPLFAKQTRIVCSQESGSVVVAEEHSRRRRWRARNFNYTNIIGTRHNCIIGFGNWTDQRVVWYSLVIFTSILDLFFSFSFFLFFFSFFGYLLHDVAFVTVLSSRCNNGRVAGDISLESCSTGCSSPIQSWWMNPHLFNISTS